MIIDSIGTIEILKFVFIL